jgi:hypothetical protein
MKKVFGIILSAAGLLAGCGMNAVSQDAKMVNNYTQSDIGTNLEKIGCKLSSNKRGGRGVEITVNNCSSITNNDAITYIKENLVHSRDHIKPLIFFKNGRQ